MVVFASEDIRICITALKYFEQFILAGVGDYLYIFDRKNCQYLRKQKIFHGQNIHGIVPHSTNAKCILFSGEKLKIIQSHTEFQKIHELAYKTISDWILDAQWIDNEHFVTVSMHNKLLIWNSMLCLESELECVEQCILYSAHIYLEGENLIIFSGTVFSDVLVWNGRNTVHGRCPILKRLRGHKGVIFSLNYNDTIGQLCSTSDDRSAFLWFLNKDGLASLNEDQDIHHVQVYGHLSRIFRCKVLKKYFLTAGEDSILNIWSHEGQLLRKIEAHQGSPIWAFDCDEDGNRLVVGGGNGGITVYPMIVDQFQEKMKLPDLEKPKLMGILSSNNVIAVSEKSILYHFIGSKNIWNKIAHFQDTKSYILLQVSHCRKLIALAGFQGQIYIYKENGETLDLIIQYQTKTKSRIFSFHWLTCYSFLVCQNGVLILFYCKDNVPVPISIFTLPPSKERWTTCGIVVGDHIIAGDRKGNIHLFKIGIPNPLLTLKRLHSFLGVTNLVREKDAIISLGRDGVIKTLMLKDNGLVLLNCDKIPFGWLLNVVDNLLVAFNGNNFIIWDRTNKRILFEQSCGGGHRSWDFHKKGDDVLFSYIKDKVINITRLNFQKLFPKDLIAGFHSDQVNYIEVIDFSQGGYVLISGGEDTILRITSLRENRFESMIVLKSHLSSIRAITSYKISEDSAKNESAYLVFSAGGRAQIICWKLDVFEENDCLKVKCQEEHSFHEPLKSEESEVRVMALVVTKIKEMLTLFSACSDGNIKVFTIGNKNGKFELVFCRIIFYKLKCLMKLAGFIINKRHVLVSMATDGHLTFWDMSDLSNEADIQPFGYSKVHQSGINSCTTKYLDNNMRLFLTGGDDNAIVLSVVEFELSKFGKMTCKTISCFTDVGVHCAQVTGLYLGSHYFLSTSIDQRLALFSWSFQNKTIHCNLVTKYDTVISDIKGLKCFETLNIYDILIYGNGMEFLKMSI